MKPVLQELPWDSKFFGMPIGQAEIGASAAAEIPALLGDARKKNLQCVYLFCDQEIRPAPGFLAEVRCYYEMDLIAGKHLPMAGDIFQPARQEDEHVLKRIAQGFVGQSRFYRDPRFASRCPAYYDAYMDKELKEHNPGHAFVTAWRQSRLAGFVTWSPESQIENRIVLIAVDPGMQGKGIGKALLHKAAQEALAEGKNRLSVRTQQNNQASCRLYESAGFLLKRNQWIYHCP